MSDAQPPLAETLDRIASLTDEAGLRRSDVINAKDLSLKTGVPVEMVEALLEGAAPEEEAVKQRVTSRLQFLLRTRHKGDGSQWTSKELAEQIGATPKWVSAILQGAATPNVEHLVAIGKVFDVGSGFFTDDSAQELRDVLQPVLNELESKAGQVDPWAAVMDKHNIRATLSRAEQLSPVHQRAVQASLAVIVDGLLSSEGKKA